jgi:hypothetical protein
MAEIALFDPQIIINNRQMVFKPNSVTITLGKGESKVEALSAGGGFIETAYSEDVSTKISKIKGMLETTGESIGLVRGWKESLNMMSITIHDREFNGSFRNMAMVNDPEIQMKSEPSIEVEFQGDPII